MSQNAKQSGADKTLRILEVIGSADTAEHPHGMTAADVSRSLKRDKSVVSRQLKSLVESGLVTRDAAGLHELGWRLYALAAQAGDHHLIRRAVPVMQRLTAVVQERSHLTVLSRNEVLTVRSESSRRLIEANGWVGRTIPVSNSSSGIALLMDHDEEVLRLLVQKDLGESPAAAAELVKHVRDSRRQGFAVADRIFDPEVIGIGAPVRDAAGRIIAALNISGPASRIAGRIHALAAEVTAAADKLTSTNRTHGPQAGEHV